MTSSKSSLLWKNGTLSAPGIRLERPRHERADDEAVAHEGGVRRRRQVIAVAHQRADVLHVDAHHREIAVPAHRIQRIERIGDGGDRAAPLHLHLPLLAARSAARGTRRPCCGMSSIAGSKMRVRADEPFLRQRVAGVGRLDGERSERLRGIPRATSCREESGCSRRPRSSGGRSRSTARPSPLWMNSSSSPSALRSEMVHAARRRSARSARAPTRCVSSLRRRPRAQAPPAPRASRNRTHGAAAALRTPPSPVGGCR